MMRTFKSEQLKVTTDILNNIECDWCKTSFQPDGSFDGAQWWCDVNNFILEWKTGSNYGSDGVDMDIESVELCHICRDKFKRAVSEMGIRINKREDNL